MYLGMNFSHKIQSRQKDSTFFPKDKYYQWDKLVRTSFDGMPLAHQYAQVKAANLFIFEEGAPLAWAAHARNGSTFIIVYSSSAMRVSKGHTKKKSKAKHNGQVQGGVTSSIDFFALFPQLTGRVRLIFLVHLYGRFPAFSRLREVFDMPWRADTYIIACECNATRVAPWADTRHLLMLSSFSEKAMVLCFRIDSQPQLWTRLVRCSCRAEQLVTTFERFCYICGLLLTILGI
eukprot:GILI01029032.1.p1 GENE.GILI01029032.1~~GILI01029032.1.p1  ORF type:complete len:233 (-),score=2.70 GILI01029032.1:19-717(-)